MANSVPFDAAAGLSALMYSIDSIPNVAGMTLNEILKHNLRDHKELAEIIAANNLGSVKIVDSSWDAKYNGAYGSMKAATFQFPNGDVYVAYQGTGRGNWKYNAESAFGSGASQMQKWALDYFENTVGNKYNNQGQLYVTGHSQGGNNAMYVTFFSKYGSLITNCISIDGPGFNEKVIEEAKRLYGEAYFELQRRKSYGVYGENDYVHNLGEVHTTPPENTFFVKTPAATDFAGFHEILTHFTDGKLNPRCGEGPVSALVAKLVDNLMKNMPKDQRYEIAVIVMTMVENLLNGEGEIFDGLGIGELIGALMDAIPLIIQTALNNPGELMDVLRALGVDDMIAKFVSDNPLVTAAILLLAPILLPIAAGIVGLACIIKAIEDIINGLKELAKNVANFVLGCLNAIKDALGAIAKWFRNTFNPGARNANANPYFRVDTTKLRSYADRINRVNTRLRNLDSSLRRVFWEVSFFDMWKFAWINMLTSGSPSLTLVRGYLNGAASRFDTAENKARGYIGG